MYHALHAFLWKLKKYIFKIALPTSSICLWERKIMWHVFLKLLFEDHSKGVRILQVHFSCIAVDLIDGMRFVYSTSHKDNAIGSIRFINSLHFMYHALHAFLWKLRKYIFKIALPTSSICLWERKFIGGVFLKFFFKDHSKGFRILPLHYSCIVHLIKCMRFVYIS